MLLGDHRDSQRHAACGGVQRSKCKAHKSCLVSATHFFYIKTCHNFAEALMLLEFFISIGNIGPVSLH